MPGTIFFDLDGTLTDPKPGITRSIQYALQRLDCAFPSEDELTWCIGPPLRSSFVILLGNDTQADEAVAFYRERFTEIGLYENSVYAGVTDMLAALRESGKRLFVGTSKPAVYAERIIAHFELGSYFEQVFGSELDGTRADKSELLAYALVETGVEPARSIMIGDRSHDMVGACNNAMQGFGVLYGYGNERELLDAGAQQVFATPQLLKAALI